MNGHERLIKTATTASPARRTRKLKQEDSASNSSQATWTAARCQRLLRPLSAKISYLRRLNQAEALLSKINCATYSEERDAAIRSHDGTGARRNHNPEGEDWECNPRPRKKIRWTYSSKTSSQTIAPPQEGENGRMACIKNGPYDLLPQCLLLSGSTSSQASVSSQETYNESFSCSDTRVDVSHKLGGSAHGDASMREPSRLLKSNTAVGRSKDRSDLCTGICDSYFAILKATQHNSASQKTGCASLFSMCLKRVPEHIAEEELWAKQQDPDDDSDISYMVYSDLEDSACGDDWKPLKDVVRAHGIRLVEAATHDGIVDSETTRCMVNHCTALRAYDAAQSLLRATIAGLLHRNQTTTTTAAFKDWVVVQNSLRDYAQTTDGGGFLYRQLIGILNSDSQLKLGDSFLRTSIANAVQSLVQGDAHSSYAIELIQTVIRRAWSKVSFSPNACIENIRRISQMKNRKASLRSRTSAEGQAERFAKATTDEPKYRFSAVRGSPSHNAIDVPNLIAMLFTLDILQLEGQHMTHDSQSQSIHLMLESAAVEAQQYIELAFLDNAIQSEGTDLNVLAVILIVRGLGSFMYDMTDVGTHASLAGSLRILSNLCMDDNGIFQVGAFIQSAASCYGHIKGQDSFDLITKLVDALMKQSKLSEQSKPRKALASKLAIAASFAFSEHTSQPSHLDWALNVEQAMCVMGEASPARALIRTPARPTPQAKAGYRWEEGICEWIAKTPGLPMSRESARASSEASEDSDTDVLAHTPMTTPEPECDLVGEISPSKKRQSRMKSVMPPLRRNGHVTTAITDLKAKAGISKRPISETVNHAAGPRDSEAFQSGGAFDDTDELSAAQYAGKRIAKFPLSASQQLPPTKSCVGQTKRRLNGQVGRHDLKQGRRQLAKVDSETSDAEDELSFS